jgi:hypothetical protein
MPTITQKQNSHMPKKYKNKIYIFLEEYKTKICVFLQEYENI